MSTVIVRMQVKPDKENEFLEIFSEVAEVVKTREAECLIYAVWKTGVPYQYYHIASYRTQAGRNYHTDLHKDGIGPRFLPCLEGDPQAEELGEQVLGILDYKSDRLID